MHCTDNRSIILNIKYQNDATIHIFYVVCDFIPQPVTETVMTWFGDVTFVFSTCPLSNKPLDVKFSDNMTREQIKQITQEYENYFEFGLTSKDQNNFFTKRQE